MAKLLFLQNLEYEFLGPMYISSILKENGHQCELKIGETLEEFEEAILDFKPDLVGFSIMTGSHEWARKIANKIWQKYKIPNIFGGAHPTFFPEFLKEDGVQMIVKGEGEEAVLEILNRIEIGKNLEGVPNLLIKKTDETISETPLRNLKSDMDFYPFPDRNLYDDLNGRLDRSVRNVITSRGCPFHCTFCFEDAMRDLYKDKGKYVRIRSIDKVIEECLRIKNETDARIIYFADDVFGMSKKWLYEFLPIYKREVGLEFICLVRADIVASDKDYAKNLAAGGCKSVFFGIESGNEDLRNLVLKKQLSNEQIISASKYLHEAGIKFRTYNILGLPGETLEDAFSTLELNIEIEADYPWCSVFSPFPGTELTNYAFENGFLDDQFAYNSLSKSFFLDSTIQMPHIEQLENLQKFFQTVVLFPKSLPLVKKLIKLKPNQLFTWWFGLVYFYVYLKSENRNFWETFRFALRNFKHVLVKQ
ncbi:MAG: radical SAM protein [Calditrichaeota bacterium]|nr:MAG: radical SAM protein [Calditrichota bacterium]